MELTDAPPHVICRTCHTTLDLIEHLADGTFDYEHAAAIIRVIGNTDHPVDPVLFDPATMELVGVCDFCAQPGPRWLYPAASFMDERIRFGSIEEWAACAECHALIEKGDDRSNRQLVVRSLERFAVAERRRLREPLLGLHDMFRAHRTGPAEAQW